MLGPICCKSYNVNGDHQFFIGSEKYIQPLTSLHQFPNFNPGRDMIFQKFRQGVSNYRTVAELRTFDGTT
jgi:hypothetical protein